MFKPKQALKTSPTYNGAITIYTFIRLNLRWGDVIRPCHIAVIIRCIAISGHRVSKKPVSVYWAKKLAHCEKKFHCMNCDLNLDSVVLLCKMDQDHMYTG